MAASGVEAFFAQSYPQARDSFLAAARDAGAAVASYENTECRGPGGERLHLDVAVVGDPAARRRLVVISGTHGIEGYSGSAVQTAWLRSAASRSVPCEASVILVHAINPWGFAHRQRVTEENVDLNRNFIDHAAGHPPNPGYAQLHPLLTPQEWSEQSVAGIFAGLDAFRKRVGEQAFSDAYNGGQFEFDDGVFFGGRREQWSNRALRAVIREHVAGGEAAALIDLHTGIGNWCDHVFLGFHAPGSAAWERARRWWGERAVNRQGSTHKALAAYKGLLVDAFLDALPGVETTATVIEFGTRSRADMQRASLSLCWLRTHGHKHPELAARVHADYVEAFYPSDAQWRAAVIAQSAVFLKQAVDGISTVG